MSGPAAEKNLASLLQGMLIPIRRARATPLQFEIDSTGIAESALVEFLADAPTGTFETRDDWKPVTKALDDLIEQLLDEEPNLPSSGRSHLPRLESRGASSGSRQLHPLAAWLDRFFNVMRTVDHRAFEILGRRLEGLHDRDIAAQLDLGLRLVQRIQQDMRASWTREIASN